MTTSVLGIELNSPFFPLEVEVYCVTINEAPQFSIAIFGSISILWAKFEHGHGGIFYLSAADTGRQFAGIAII